jgi:tRNA(Ile)-lysidine synthase TilS/MesJ
MALAYLMKNVNQQDLGMQMNFTAFVVNHNVRDGSNKEAKEVCNWLSRLGRTEAEAVDTADDVRHRTIAFEYQEIAGGRQINSEEHRE